VIENMWSLNLSDTPTVNPPVNIVEKQCEYLREATSGRVIAKVLALPDLVLAPDIQADGRIVHGHAAQPVPQAQSKHVKPSIQEHLGDLGSIYFEYEFFLTSPCTPNYKFRIMFFSYSVEPYPVNIVLDSDIAKELREEQYISCLSEVEFIVAVKNILISDKVNKVIAKLNAVALHEENKRHRIHL